MSFLRLATILCLVTSACGQTSPSSIDSLLAANHFKRAEAALKPQFEKNPKDPQLNYQMSQVSLVFGRIDDAIAQAERAVASNNTRADYRAQLVDALGAKLNDPSTGFLARLSLARRFQSEAETALKLDPRNFDVNSDLLQFYLEAPGMAGGDKSKASALAEQLAKLDPAHGYVLKAQFADHEHRTAEAEQFYKQAVEAAPGDYDIVATVANFYLNLENHQGLSRAEELARQALKIDPTRIDGYNVLAVLYVKQRRWSDLAKAISDTEAFVPDNLSPQYQAGKFIVVTAATDEFPLAEKMLRRYLTQPPEAGSPPLAAAHWRIGQILEKEGHRDEAKKELQIAVQLDPALRDAQQDLKRLR